MLETGCWHCGWAVQINFANGTYLDDTHFDLMRELHDRMSPDCSRPADDKLVLKYDSEKSF